MVGLYRTNVLVLPFLFRFIAFSHQAPLYKDDKSKDKSVNGSSVSKSFVPTVLALVLSVSFGVLEMRAMVSWSGLRIALGLDPGNPVLPLTSLER